MFLLNLYVKKIINIVISLNSSYFYVIMILNKSVYLIKWGDLMRSRTIEFLGHAVGSAVGSAAAGIATNSNRRNQTNNTITTVNNTTVINYNAPQNTQPVNNTQAPVQIDLKCPNCMGERTIDENNMVLVCPYCESRQIIPANQIAAYRRLSGSNNNNGYYQTHTPYNPSMQQYPNNNNQNWQPINQPVHPNPQPAMSIPQGAYNPNYQRPKNRTWLWVLGWIFIFPVPLTILMLRNRTISPAIRYTIIAVVWIFYAIIGFSGGSNNNSATTTKEMDIAVTVSDTELKGENYEDVLKRLQVAGFKNIELRPMEDLVTGWVSDDGDVEKVSINGVTSFSKYDKFPASAEIIITYHSFDTKEDSSKNKSENSNQSEEKEKAS